MSRIGNRVLIIPEGVEFSCSEKNLVIVKGAKGTLEMQMANSIKIVSENNEIKVNRKNNQKHQKQLHGTVNSLIKSISYEICSLIF